MDNLRQIEGWLEYRQDNVCFIASGRYIMEKKEI